TRIVMPEHTPDNKVQATEKLGAEVVLQGDSYEEAYDYATELSDTEGALFVHPFDDWGVIEGQATVGKEISEQLEQ
ncbi:MAG: pyridoxal-phosphate dependent enzyme, partial [bacterium]